MPLRFDLRTALLALAAAGILGLAALLLPWPRPKVATAPIAVTRNGVPPVVEVEGPLGFREVNPPAEPQSDLDREVLKQMRERGMVPMGYIEPEAVTPK